MTGSSCVKNNDGVARTALQVSSMNWRNLRKNTKLTLFDGIRWERRSRAGHGFRRWVCRKTGTGIGLMERSKDVLEI